MPLADTALVSLEEAHAFLACGESGHAVLQDRINEASAAIEAWCRRPFKGRLFSLRVEGPWGPKLYPDWPAGPPIDRARPVTVTVDGQTQTVWKLESDGDRAAFDVWVEESHFYRPQGWRSCSPDPYNVLLSYWGGFAAIPSDVKLACLYTVQVSHGRDQQAGQTEVVSYSAPGGSLSLEGSRELWVLPRKAVGLLAPYVLYGAR